MKQVKLAILGVGAIAHTMAKAAGIVPDFMEKYAIAARDLDRAQAFAAQYGFAKAYGSYDALLADPEVELVYLAVPHSLHCEYAVRCMRAGKHVLSEKPFAVNAAQASEMIAVSRETGKMCAEGLWMRYLPMAKRIQDVVRSGCIGNIRMMTGSIGYHLTQSRLFDPETAGGALLDVGVYALAFAGMLFGYDVQNITTSASLTDRGVDEYSSIILQYTSGVMVTLSLSMTYMSNGGGTIWGDNGYITIDNLNHPCKVEVYNGNKQLVETIEREPYAVAYAFEAASAAKALREGRLDTPEAEHAEILARMRLMDTIRAEWGMKYPFEA